MSTDREKDKEKIKRLRKKLFYYHDNKNFRAAARISEALLRAHARFSSTKTIECEDDMYNAALVNGEAGHIDRAVALYSEAATRAFARLGPDLLVAERLTNLGVLLSLHGENEENHESACRLLMQTLAIRKLYVRHDHISIGDALYNMGNALIRAGRCNEALPPLKTAMDIYTKCESPNLINCLYVIATAHEKLGEYEEAYPYAETAMSNLANSDEEEYYKAKYYLAHLYEATGRNSAACKLYTSVMNRLEKIVGCNHSSYMNLAAKVASQKAKLGDYSNSKDILIKLSRLIEDTIGLNSLTYTNCIRNLAEIHRQLGEWEEAEILLKEKPVFDVLIREFPLEP